MSTAQVKFNCKSLGVQCKHSKHKTIEPFYSLIVAERHPLRGDIYDDWTQLPSLNSPININSNLVQQKVLKGLPHIFPERLRDCFNLKVIWQHLFARWPLLLWRKKKRLHDGQLVALCS